MSKKVLYFIEYTWLLILLSLVSLYYLSQININSVFNSDITLLPSLYRDLFVNHNHYRDWFLSPAAHFFPDGFLFFLIATFTKNIYFEFLVFKWVMVILTYFTVKYLYFQFFTRKISMLFALMATSVLVILNLREFQAYNLFLILSAHAGECIIGLLILAVLVKIVDNTKYQRNFKTLYGIIAILIFLCSASDLLFVIQFSIPFIFAFIALYLKKWIKLKKLALLSSLCIIPTILAALLSKYIIPHSVLSNYLDNPSLKKISATTVIFQLSELIKLIKLVVNLPWYIFILFYSSIITIFIIGVFKNLDENNLSQKIFFISAFIFFCIITNIIALLILIHGVADRYFLPFYYFPCLMFFLPLSLFKKNNNIKKIFSGIFLLTILYCVIKISPLFFRQNLKPKFSYYPLEINCIDRFLPANAHGVAEYWDANVLSLLSKKNISIVPVTKFLEPIYWGINSTKFTKPSSFVILSHINPPFDLYKDIVYARYGNPKKIIRCENKTLLIYPESSLSTTKNQPFSHVGDAFNWPAAYLPSPLSNSKNGNQRIAKSTDSNSFLSYGPYIFLPEGRYHFYIKYSSNEIRTKKPVAYYDVYSRTSGVIYKKFIYGTQGKPGEMFGKFKVNREQANKDLFEIRVFYLGSNNFVLESITLVKD